MNQTLQVIAERFSCRAFTDIPPSDEQLQAIAEAAIAAPSAMNRQAWRVIIVQDRALIADMEAEGMRSLAAAEDQAAYQSIQQRGGTLFYHAPCMIMVAIDPTGAAGVAGAALDCGILCENVALAATSMGLGSLICGLAGLAFSQEKAEEFRRRLGFPDGYEFGIAILLGSAAARGAPHALDSAKISWVR